MRLVDTTVQEQSKSVSALWCMHYCAYVVTRGRSYDYSCGRLARLPVCSRVYCEMEKNIDIRLNFFLVLPRHVHYTRNRRIASRACLSRGDYRTRCLVGPFPGSAVCSSIL